MHLRFLANFESVRKDKEKLKKKIKTLAACILKLAGAISFKFGM